MKRLPVVLCVPLVILFSVQADAARKKTRHHHYHHHHHGHAAGRHVHRAHEEKAENQAATTERTGRAEHEAVQTAPSTEETTAGATTGTTAGPGTGAAPDKTSLNFNFFGGSAAAAATGQGQTSPAERKLVNKLEAEGRTRRWMLEVHQTLGIATWVAMAATVVVGQLNYNQLWGGGGGSTKWQTPHRVLVLTTTALFAATGGFALFAPTPYKRPLHFDTGMVHRLAVIGATLGMIAEGVLGWEATHEADAGNPGSRSVARAHQIIGYTTFGFMTIAGTTWIYCPTPPARGGTGPGRSLWPRGGDAWGAGAPTTWC